MSNRSTSTGETPSWTESERLAALDRYQILDTASQPEFDELVELASQIAGTPISLISLVDASRQWFKAKKGLTVPETPRAIAFCAHAIQQQDILEVQDATVDPRFAGNPLVTGEPDLRFYAGVPLTTPEGLPLGTLCVLDNQPHPALSEQQRKALQIVARQVMAQLELRRFLAGQKTERETLTSENQLLQDKVIEQTGELRVNAEALRQSQKMEALGQLTGGIAHDFNNLLQGIVGSVTAARKLIAVSRVNDADRFLGMVVSSAHRAAALTNRLLAFARQQPMAPETIDVQEQLGTLLEIMRRICGESIELRIEDQPDLWTIRCDPSQLENAVLNLVINARDAMPGGGKLVIRFGNQLLTQTPGRNQRAIGAGEFVTISVEDRGTGMTAETVDRAFDAFFTTKPAGQGTGLGLSMVAAFARQAGGFADITSELGTGTTVTLYLPRSDRLVSKDILQHQTLDARDLSDINVAIVEDDSVVRNLMASLLTESGCRVFQASDGPSALRVLESMERVDLLVTDIGLPGLNGRRLAHVAKAIRPGLKVLLISGYGQESSGTDAIAEEILAKPFSMENLVARVKDLVGRDGTRDHTASTVARWGDPDCKERPLSP